MKKKSPPKIDDPEQAKRFKEAARKIGADESNGALDKALKKVTNTISSKGYPPIRS